MIIGVLKEALPGETRVAATPATVAQLLALGYDVVVEPGAGARVELHRRGVRRAGADDRRRPPGRPTSCFGVNAPAAGRARPAARGGDAGQPARAGAQPGPASRTSPVGRSRRWRWTRCRGSRARSRWTCCQLDGQHRRLPRGDRGGARVRPVLHRPGHGGGQGAAGEGAGRRRRRRRPRRDRRGGQPGRDRARHRPAARGRRPGRSLGGEYLAVEAEESRSAPTGYAKEMSEDYNAPRRRRSTPSRPPDVDIVITTALIPGRPGAEADHRRDGRGDEARQRDRRHGRGQRRQRRGHGRRRGRGHRQRRHDHRLHRPAGPPAAQASQLYGTNLVNLMKLMTPAKDGAAACSTSTTSCSAAMTVVRDGEMTWPPPPVQVSAAPRRG